MRHGTNGLSTPSFGRRAEDFLALKNPTASAGFEPANLGTKGQHATSRPPKPLIHTTNYTSITFEKPVKFILTGMIIINVIQLLKMMTLNFRNLASCI